MHLVCGNAMRERTILIVSVCFCILIPGAQKSKSISKKMGIWLSRTSLYFAKKLRHPYSVLHCNVCSKSHSFCAGCIKFPTCKTLFVYDATCSKSAKSHSNRDCGRAISECWSMWISIGFGFCTDCVSFW